MSQRSIFLTLLILLSSISGLAQTPQLQGSALPRLVKYAGTVQDSDGHARSGSVGVIFAIYDKEDGIAPVWLESQSVTTDESGRYTVLLGSTKADGLPASIFVSGEARWIGVQAEGQAEQPRTLLVSVPYALKAADADTLGGKPLSAFLLADSGASSSGTKSQRLSDGSHASRETTAAVDNGGVSGTVNFLTKWTSAINIGNSLLFDNGTNVGIGTATPGAKLDVNGNILFSVAPGQAGFAGFNVSGDGVFRAGINMPNLLGEGVPTRQGAFFTMDMRPSQNVLAIWTKQANSSTELERVTIQAGGNVGIGNASPAQKLDVGGNVAVNGNLQLTSAALNAGLKGFNLSGDGVFRAGVNMPNLLGEGDDTRQGTFFTMDTRAGQSAMSIWTKAAGSPVETERFTLQSTGNVGINNSSPTAAFDVNGIVRATGGFKFADSTLQTTAATLTGVSAGSGLMGGGTSGNVSLSLATTCTAGQILKWSGTAWACAADATSGGGGGTTLFDGSSAVNTAIVTVNQHGTGNTNPDALTNVPPAAVSGFADSTTGFTAGLLGKSTSPNGLGVLGIVTGGPTQQNSAAIIGIATSTTGKAQGVSGQSSSPDGVGGDFSNDNNLGTALRASVGPNNGSSISQFSVQGSGINMNASNINIQGPSGPNVSVQIGGSTTINGNLTVNGTVNASNGSFASLSKPGGSFKIDHPLDPAGKILYHSFVESPDMMNIYNGVITLDSKGQAWITMPEWFEALNMEFRYQLTAMGRPAPNLYVASEMSGNRFKISGGPTHGKVSWQVTGIRHDAWANAHRIPVEVEKPSAEQGTYLYPELFQAREESKLASSKPKVEGLGK